MSEHVSIEKKIWLAAYLAARRLRVPEEAERLANDATVRLRRKWSETTPAVDLAGWAPRQATPDATSEASGEPQPIELGQGTSGRPDPDISKLPRRLAPGYTGVFSQDLEIFLKAQ